MLVANTAEEAGVVGAEEEGLGACQWEFGWEAERRVTMYSIFAVVGGGKIYSIMARA